MTVKTLSVLLFKISTVLSLLLLAACSSLVKDRHPPRHQHINVANIPNPTPKTEPKSKYGNPISYVVNGKRYYVLNDAQNYRSQGLASWYGTKFHNRRTSSGENYDMYKMTAASTTLPLPTYVKVTNLKNNKWIIVRVNDRGPFVANRIIDLSFVAAKKLDMIKTGTAMVRVETVTLSQPNSQTRSNYTELNQPIYLQVGAFSTRAAAQRLAEELKPHSPQPIHIVKAQRSNQELYKVQTGPFKMVKQIKSLTAKFDKLGFSENFTVVK